MNLPSIIDAAGLPSILKNENTVLIDVSGSKQKPVYLHGALFVDLNKQLSDIKENPANGGRHPLPTPSQFSATLSRLGITPDTHVILYDEQSGANAAARMWWMLKAAGHEKVQVLNGGMQAAIGAAFPTAGEPAVAIQTSNYNFDEWALPMATIDEVDALRNDEQHIVIDVRDSCRFAGIKEPIDLVAGHIPGAINVPFTTNLDADGTFKSPTSLAGLYGDILGNKSADSVIVHCGSGVTACHTLLAMDYAGLSIPKLYVGSWSEWSRNDKPIGKNDD